MANRLKTDKWPASKPAMRAVHELKPHPRNTKKHPASQIKVIAGLIEKHGWTNPVLIDAKNRIIAGHGRIEAAKLLGIIDVPCIVAEGWTEAEIRAYVIADNKSAEMAEWDIDRLRDELAELGAEGINLEGLGFSSDELDELLKAPDEPRPPSVSLGERFGLPPFSVLNAREGWWQDRKRAWLALGIKSEVGRGENLLKMSDTVLQPDPKKRAAKAKTFHDGAVIGKGKGGLADQVAKAATRRRKSKEAA